MAGIGGSLCTYNDLVKSLCFDFFVGNFKAFACPSPFLLHTSGTVARASLNNDNNNNNDQNRKQGTLKTQGCSVVNQARLAFVF